MNSTKATKVHLKANRPLTASRTRTVTFNRHFVSLRPWNGSDTKHNLTSWNCVPFSLIKCIQ